MDAPIQMFLDVPSPGSNVWVSRPVCISGWAFSKAGPIERIEVFLGEESLGTITHRIERLDVAAAFPNSALADCGYYQFVDLNDPQPGNYELILQATDAAGNIESVRQPVMLIVPPKRASGELLSGKPYRAPAVKRSGIFSRSARRICGAFKSRHPPTVEIRIPISANEKYLRMVHYFLESLQVFGGPLGRAAHCVVSVSRDESYRDLYQECPWASRYSVEFQWLDNALFDRRSYDGTGLHRFHVQSKADIVVLADADLIVAGDFDPVIWEAYRSQRLLGCIAHISPFDYPELRHIPSRRWWNWIFEEAGLPKPRLNRVHTGWGYMSKDIRHRRCPDYFNYGFLVAPRSHVERMGETFEMELEAVERVVESWAKSQIANSMTFVRHAIPCGTLSINYNFPLHASPGRMRAFNPDPDGKDSAEDVKIFHYLGAGKINRECFATRESLEELLQLDDLSAAESVFQRKLQIVHEKIVTGLAEVLPPSN